MNHILAIAIITIPTFVIVYIIEPPDPFNFSITNIVFQSILYASIVYFIVYLIATQLKADLLNKFNISLGGLNISFG